MKFIGVGEIDVPAVGLKFGCNVPSDASCVNELSRRMLSLMSVVRCEGLN